MNQRTLDEFQLLLWYKLQEVRITVLLLLRDGRHTSTTPIYYPQIRCKQPIKNLTI